MIGLAAGLWFAVFYLPFSNFWLKISISAALLAGLSIRIQPIQPGELRIDRNALIQGCISAIFLYAIFWLGKTVSKAMFSFASPQIDAIYGKGEGTSLFLVFFLLLLVTGPCEELFWRRFLQQNLVKRYGKWPGWILATAVYAGVHIWSFNFMLIGAAAVAGAFWGLLYLRWKRITPVIISHALWSSMIFSVVPVP
ncbi:MAG: hypothetical protein A2V65_03905 [Deltaproteobacteria bacterium RBG_13_49_15]|jgi:membrane protease YdiL (CAAX protease family)|nr:MAG: hypothetical protein A2V65_03905 [Deltaproteobacteria bacterium RBG_13_49_15]